MVIGGLDYGAERDRQGDPCSDFEPVCPAGEVDAVAEVDRWLKVEIRGEDGWLPSGIATPLCVPSSPRTAPEAIGLPRPLGLLGSPGFAVRRGLPEPTELLGSVGLPAGLPGSVGSAESRALPGLASMTVGPGLSASAGLVGGIGLSGSARCGETGLVAGVPTLEPTSPAGLLLGPSAAM